MREGGPVPRPDLVIVARGGGSIEDLWSFNEERVVRAVAECSIPIISAVGHETDTTLVDYASDKRAPTPTAAAEMAVPVRADLAAFLGDLGNRQKRAIHRPIELGRERLEARIKRMPQRDQLLQPHAQRLDELTERLRRGLTDRASEGRTKLAGAAARLSPSLLQRRASDAQSRLKNARLVTQLVTQPLEQKREKLDALARLASQFHPEKPLERGYAIVRDSEGAALTSQKAASSHNALSLQFSDGTVDVAQSGAHELAAKPETPKKPAKKPPKRSRPAANPAQDDLFG